MGLEWHYCCLFDKMKGSLLLRSCEHYTGYDMITATCDIIKLLSNTGPVCLCLSVLVMSMLQSCYNMLAACVMSPPAAAQTPLSSCVMTIRGYFNKTASITISNTRARVTGTRRKCSCSQEPREKWGEWERNDFHLVIRFLFPWIISARAAWQLGERAGRTMWPIHDHGNRKWPILTWTTYIFRSSQNREYLTVIRCRGCSWSFTSRHQAQVIL